MQITFNTKNTRLLCASKSKTRSATSRFILVLDAGHSARKAAYILDSDDATIYRRAAVYRNVGLADYLKQNGVPYYASKLTEEQPKAIRPEFSSCLYIVNYMQVWYSLLRKTCSQAA